MSKPICSSCGAVGVIQYRNPGVHYCPELSCPVGEIRAAEPEPGTITIPLADYQELLAAVTELAKLKQGIGALMEKLSNDTYPNPDSTRGQS